MTNLMNTKTVAEDALTKAVEAINEMHKISNKSVIQNVFLAKENLDTWDIILSVGLLALFLVALLRYKKVRTTGLVVFIAGIFLYWTGYDCEGTGKSIMALLFRSVLSSLEMFLGHSDLIEVHHEMHKSAMYMTLFALTHFCALSVSLMLLFKIFGQRVWYFFKLLYSSFSNNQDLYVFFGFNENSKILAQNIRKESKKNKIVFVNLFRKTENEEEEETSFMKLIGVFASSNSKVKEIWDMNIDSFYAHGKKDFSEIQQEASHWKDKKPDSLQIFKELELNNLRRWILNGKKIKIFFMSEDMEYNLLSLDQLVMDPYFQKDLADNRRVVVYCHADRNNSTLQREQQYLCYRNLEVHIIDSSYLSVCQLKADYHNLPANFVEFKNGIAMSEFTAMVIGFGETGQDAFDFLYGYSSFVDKDMNQGPSHIIAVDEKMATIKAAFLEKRPALKDEVKEGRLEFLPCSITSEDFWNKLNQCISKLNYVVIALGDDKMNTSLAIELYECVIRYRNNDLSNFKIYVRAYNPTNETRLNYIEKYINQTNNPQLFSNVFNVFGNTDKIYRFETISAHDEDSKIMENVQTYYKNYSSLSGDTDSWYERRQNKLDLKDNAYEQDKQFPSLMFRLREVMRLEGQDYENYYHMDTKLLIMGLPCDKKWDELSISEQVYARTLYSALCAYIDSEKGLDVFPKDIADLVISLSATEHVRWNNSHKLLGYVYQAEPGDEKKLRDVRMTHKCIVPWNNLDYATKRYDTMVVATTLNTRFPELLTK